jgi:nucleotide-binding universal stress UspA family protein
MYEILTAVDDENYHVTAQIDAIEGMITVSDEAVVHLLHVFTDNPSGASIQQVETVRNAKRRLESLDVEVRLEETSGEPAEEICAYAEKRDVDQICVGGRKRSPAGKALFGSVSQSVILATDRPVLVCGAKADV